MFRQGSISRAWHRGSAFMGVGDLRLNFVSLLSDIFVEKGTSEDLTVLKEKKTHFSINTSNSVGAFMAK